MAEDPSTDPNTDPAGTDPETGSNSSEPATGDIEAAKESAIADFLKTVGVGSTDELKNIVSAKNEADKANKTDLENTQSDLKKANDNVTDLTSQLASLKAANAVLKAGVTAEHAEDATILAQARVSSGQAKDIDKAIKDVLKSNPQFTGDVATGKDGTAVVNGNVGGNSEHKKLSISERIAKLNAGRITN